MFAHEATSEVSADPSTAYAFLADPCNQVELTPGLTALSEAAPETSFSLQYSYEVAGVVLSGQLRDTLRRSPSRIVRTLSGSLDGSFRFRLEETASGTRISFGITVRLPAPVEEALSDAVVEGALEEDVKATLETLHSRLDQ